MTKKKTATRLANVKKERIEAGTRFAFYGPESVGKTTLAANATEPIFGDCEDGSGNLDVARYPFRDGPTGHVPETYQDVLAMIQDLDSTEHEFRTLVIDTLDRLEALIWAYVVERDSGRQSNLNKSGKRLESIESYGYGKGYVLALDVWRELCRDLDRLRLHRKMDIILLGHAQIRTFKNPEGDDYDRYHLRIKDNAAGFVKEWCDVVGFCCFEEFGAREDDGSIRAKGYSTGRRIIKLQRTAAYDAKSRIPLPAEVELSSTDPWGPLSEALRSGRNMSPLELVELMEVELHRIGDPALAARVHDAIAKARNNAGTLIRYLNDLKQRQPVAKPED